MSSTPKEIGTLIVVVLKANHLPNKRHIGKQDPYCVVTVNGEKRRTKAIKRGGQHPEWDEEIRFTLVEDTDDVLARMGKHRSGTPPPLPPKDGPSPRKIKGGKFMKLQCFADDPREPDLIGEADVDLTEVLTKGETDEWFELQSKGKFAGKVYLELTFWSNEPPPEKKVAPKPVKNNKQYGGPGSFIPSGERIPGQHPSRQASANAGFPTNGPPDLYVAPYEQQGTASQVDRLAHDFGEFGIHTGRRRESFPPQSSYSHYPQGSYNGYPADDTASYAYDRPPSPNSQASTFQQYGYQPQYDPNQAASYQSSIRGPRHSVPVSSSGFAPLPQPSGFMPLQPGSTEPYPPPVAHTPAPVQYPPAHSQFTSSTSYSSQAASPVTYMPGPAPVPPYQPPVPHSQTYPTYPNYQYSGVGLPSPPQAYPPADYAPVASSPASPPPGSVYQPYPGPDPSSSLPPPPPPPAVAPAAPSTVGGSRPLPPQPQVVYSQPPPPPPSHLSPSPNGAYSPPQNQGTVSPARSGSHPLPLPPAPPPLLYNEPSTFASGPAPPLLPPPPPPPSVVTEVRQRRLSALPQPPTIYQQQAYQTIPNGSALDNYNYNQSGPRGPPPQPPAQEWSTYNH